MTGHGPEEGPGPPPPELGRFLGAAQDWVRQTFPAAGPEGHGGPECQWCPLCQFMAVLRGDRPEVTERVAEAGTAIATAFRALVESGAAPAGPTAEPGDDPATPAGRVQHIDLGTTEDDR